MNLRKLDCCTPELIERYNQIDRMALPLLKARSRKLSNKVPGIEYDDALQEGRIAVLVALTRYDEAKSPTGDILPYLNKVLTNTYRGMLYEVLTQSKVPYVEEIGADGVRIKKPCFPISLDAMLNSEDGEVRSYDPPDDAVSQETRHVWKQMQAEVGKFTMKMYNTLTGMDLDVFRCMVHPSREFLESMYMDGENIVYRRPDGELALQEGFHISHSAIKKYLNITKTQLDWSRCKIRMLFLKMANFDFSELLGDHLKNKKWPVIHMSEKPYDDLEFKREVFRKRLLNHRIKATSFASSKRLDDDGAPFFCRVVKWYDWGCAVTLKNGKLYVTLVLEGRFNPNTGVLFGELSGAQQKIPVDWYCDMLKELK